MFLSINLNSVARLSCSVSCNCPKSADSAGFTWFAHWRLQISTSAALNGSPLCVITSLLLTAGIKIISSMIPIFKYCQRVQNSFRIYITEGLFFSFNETAFDNTLKVRNSSLKTDYIGNALWEKVVHPLWEQPLQSWLRLQSDSPASKMDPLLRQWLDVVVRQGLGAPLKSKSQLSAAVEAAVKTLCSRAEVIAFLLISHPALQRAWVHARESAALHVHGELGTHQGHSGI